MAAIDHIHNRWLPASGYHHTGGPEYEYYGLAFEPDDPETDDAVLHAGGERLKRPRTPRDLTGSPAGKPVRSETTIRRIVAYNFPYALYPSTMIPNSCPRCSASPRPSPCKSWCSRCSTPSICSWWVSSARRQLAAVTLGNQFFFLLAVLMFGLGTGGRGVRGAVLGQARSRGDPPDVGADADDRADGGRALLAGGHLRAGAGAAALHRRPCGDRPGQPLSAHHRARLHAVCRGQRLYVPACAAWGTCGCRSR